MVSPFTAGLDLRLGSPCGGEPAGGCGVGGLAERLKFVVPGLAQQLDECRFQAAAGRGCRHGGLELSLGYEDVAVGAGHGRERPEGGRVAVADGVAAWAWLFGDFEPELPPRAERGRDGARGAGLGLEGEGGAWRQL